ncbi:type IA DNA topoisomerase [Bacillus alkalicellulosilyticus]|uniref:type IA DNA topoisomerase n=1 Tax=Alkalihalobacterium alkalicellulosilyticum TaxID=1912214 RepID=UPI000998831C|nr:type IA DNA topoisomerase [Bacillus alkalicellulosilyticus]
MGKYLFLAEKPSQAKQLAKPFKHASKGSYIEIEPCSYLPNGAFVVHAVGHLCELAQPSDYNPKWKDWSLSDLPLAPPNLEFKLKVSPSGRNQFSVIKRLVLDKSVSTIIHACDPAREGQSIGDHILNLIGNKKPVKRLWTTSLTKDAVLKSLAQLKDNAFFLPLYHESIARQRSDWIMGLSMTRLMTLLLQEKGVHSLFTVGRVQTSLLSIIYEREKSISRFVSKPYWDIEATFKIGNSKFTGKWFKPDEEHIFERGQAQLLAEYCKQKEAYVYSLDSEKQIVKPPQFYNLTDLQIEGNKKLGLSPMKVLEIAQNLYEQGLISYPRSQPKHVTPNEAALFPVILDNLREMSEYKEILSQPIRDISNDKRYIDESKVDDHHAIILTEQPVKLSTLTKHEQIIYDLVARSMIAAHLPDAVFNNTDLVTVVDNKFSFITKASLEVEKGWQVIKDTNSREGKNQLGYTLPNIAKGDKGHVSQTQLDEGKTTPPVRFTQGHLVKVMENASSYIPANEKEGLTKKELSLGTVATRANIVNQLLKQGYLRIEKNKVYMETKGNLLIDALGPESFLTSPITTGKMEQYLEQIGNGKADYSKFVARILELTKQHVAKTIDESKHWDFSQHIVEMQKQIEVGVCFLCGSPVIDKGHSYTCSSYQSSACTFSISKKFKNKELTKHQVSELLKKRTTPLIKGIQKSNKEGTYDAFLVWNDDEGRCKVSFEGVPLKQPKGK